MNTSYIRLVQCFDDPVWGRQAMPWIKSPLIRVHRNRLRKSIVEWVGSGKPCNLDQYRNASTVVMREDNSLEARLPNWIYMRTMPLP